VTTGRRRREWFLSFLGAPGGNAHVYGGSLVQILSHCLFIQTKDRNMNRRWCLTDAHSLGLGLTCEALRQIPYSTFLTQRNRELFRRSREFRNGNRNGNGKFYWPEMKSSPDEILGTQDGWIMSAVTSKADISSLLCHDR